MAATFDPYLTWLQIPVEEQPPHHYRLLGVTAYEENAMVISLAADRQIAFLESVDDAEHGFLAQQLVKSIEAARACLLDARRKENYDTKLRAKLNGADLPSKPTPASAPTAASAPLAVQEIQPLEIGDEHLDEPQIEQSGADGTDSESADPDWPIKPSWMSEQPAAEKAPPKAVPARANSPAPRTLPRSQPAAEPAGGGDDALSFLGGPGGKISAESATSPSSASRGKPNLAATKGRPTEPRNTGKKDASGKPAGNNSRLLAIFIPSGITVIALLIYLFILMGGKDDPKKDKPKSGDKPAVTSKDKKPGTK